MSHIPMQWRMSADGPVVEPGTLYASDIFPDVRFSLMAVDRTEIAKRFARALRAQGVSANAHTGHVNFGCMGLATLRFVLEEMNADWATFKARQNWLLVADQVPPEPQP